MQDSNGNRTWQEHIERHDVLITRILEQQDAFQSDLGNLLRAQVQLTEAQEKPAKALQPSDEKLTEAQRCIEVNLAKATEKLNALIAFLSSANGSQPFLRS